LTTGKRWGGSRGTRREGGGYQTGVEGSAQNTRVLPNFFVRLNRTKRRKTGGGTFRQKGWGRKGRPGGGEGKKGNNELAFRPSLVGAAGERHWGRGIRKRG